VRQRTLLLDRRQLVFITEDGAEVEKTDTQGVVNHVERWVNRRLRGSPTAPRSNIPRTRSAFVG
jgi:hypothetical protein